MDTHAQTGRWQFWIDRGATFTHCHGRKERLKDLGSDGVGNTQEEFGRFVADEHAKYGKLIKTMGINPE